MFKKIKLIGVFILFFAIVCTANVKVFASDFSSKITNEDLIYFIMTDRFYDGDTSNDKDVIKGDLSAYNGGDFQGIIDKLDYIKDLGFTVIWISPVVENQSMGYHGYWATDFYKTNEHFGTMDKLKELVTKAHSKGIKVIFDIVLNHTGSLHPFVNNPKYTNWFHEYSDISDYNDQQQVENGWLAGLPDLNQDNPEVKKYLIDMAKWWIKETGIDGYRLDTTRHVPKSFWQDFSKEIRKDYPDFYLIGEVFNGDINYVGSYQNTGIDGLTDFPLYYAINDVFKDSKSAVELADAISNADNYKNRDLMGTFIDNHDVPRFVNQISSLTNERLESALTFMMTYTGIPIMYYGTEIGLDGGADPDNRKDMDWNAKSNITDYVKKLVNIRKTNKALTNGDIKILKVDNNFISFSRRYKDNTVIVAFNTSDSKNNVQFDIPEQDKSNEKLAADLLTSKEYKIKNGIITLDMAPMQANIFVYKESKPVLSPIILIAGITFIVIISMIIIRKKILNS